MLCDKAVFSRAAAFALLGLKFRAQLLSFAPFIVQPPETPIVAI
jgi:hypothetical protein